MTTKDAGLHLKTDAYNFLFLDIRTRGGINVLGMPTVVDADVLHGGERIFCVE